VQTVTWNFIFLSALSGPAASLTFSPAVDILETEAGEERSLILA
jgi:hypothetical protein